jgi:hypothetical protein
VRYNFDQHLHSKSCIGVCFAQRLLTNSQQTTEPSNGESDILMLLLNDIDWVMESELKNEQIDFPGDTRSFSFSSSHLTSAQLFSNKIPP